MRRERRLWEVWLVAAGVTATTAGMLIAAEPPSPPRLMADVLRARAEWRLLDPATDLVGDYTIKQLEELHPPHGHTPWLRARL